MILASAGSGKTYALVNRYLRLLALGVNPTRIIALTFTRKAAGEFLQKIFLRLRAAANDPEEASRLSVEIGANDNSCSFYRKILLDLVGEMGRLQLGTIDSFFGKIVGAYPFELGLSRPHRVMDDFEQDQARQQVMGRLLASSDEDQATRLLHIYKQLTWGVEEKNVYRMFDESLKDYQSVYLEKMDLDCWGMPRRIFPAEPWWLVKDEDRTSLLGQLDKELASLDLKQGMAKGFAALIGKLRNWQAGMDLMGGTLWDRLCESRDEIANGFALVTYNRSTLTLEGKPADVIYRLIQSVVRDEIRRKLLITQSLGQLLGEYENHYEQSVRESGSLVFSDFPVLLSGALCGEDSSILASDILFRMDGQVDHWLLDEFQDTSRLQWKVLSAFVDEVLQDPSGERSFFYVGDIKQSIYGWRGGDARLFKEIYNAYSDGERGIHMAQLNHSYRSAPAVLNCVNDLFGAALPGQLIGTEAADRWKEDWSDHEASDLTKDLAGYAGWGLVDDSAEVKTACIDVVNTVKPLERGLSCAILLRVNSEVQEMTEALRGAGIQASMEGVVNIARDNVVGCWILAFLYSLVRPGEAFSRAYLSLHGKGIEDEEYKRLAGLFRSTATHSGYADAVRKLIDFLKPLIGGDVFLTVRCEQILESVARFENSELRTVESLIAFLESATVAESTLHTHVQVMTVHKAKGLDFDMVIVAGFGTRPIVRTSSRSVHVQRQDQGEIDWIMDLPRKGITVLDPVLARARQAHTDDEIFESLCLLYVAMTRAKLGLYCISESPRSNSRTARWHDVMDAAFGYPEVAREEDNISWKKEWGDFNWYAEKEPKPEVVVEVALDAIAGPLPESRKTLRRMPSPSQESHSIDNSIRQMGSNVGRIFGTHMHDFLALVEWVDVENDEQIENLVAQADESLRERLRNLLKSESGKTVFMKPDSKCHLWREKPYVLRKGSQVAQGIIDRAVLYIDASGQIDRVIIYDFKTDRLEPGRSAEQQLAERYAVQLERYAEAVNVLTGVGQEAITTKLISV